VWRSFCVSVALFLRCLASQFGLNGFRTGRESVFASLLTIFAAREASAPIVQTPVGQRAHRSAPAAPDFETCHPQWPRDEGLNTPSSQVPMSKAAMSLSSSPLFANDIR
jgi:hypothetical protein